MLGREDIAGKRCETGAWETPEAIPESMDGILDERCPSCSFRSAAKSEG